MKYLVVVDMQNDFISGSLGSEEAKSIVDKVRNRVLEFSGSVVFTMDTHGDDYLESQEGANLPINHCIYGSYGWDIEESIWDASECRDPYCFEKHTFGSLGLCEHIRIVNSVRPIEEVVIVGLCTDICVISNAIMLKSFVPEVKISIDASCCAGTTPENHENALRAMRQCQIYIENWED